MVTKKKSSSLKVWCSLRGEWRTFRIFQEKSCHIIILLTPRPPTCNIICISISFLSHVSEVRKTSIKQSKYHGVGDGYQQHEPLETNQSHTVEFMFEY